MTRYLRVGNVPRRVVPPLTVTPPTTAKSPTLGNWTTAYFNSSSSVPNTLQLPSFAAGDIVTVWIHDGILNLATIDQSGWTKMVNYDYGDGAIQQWYKVMTASDLAYVTFSGFSGTYAHPAIANTIRANGGDLSSPSADGTSSTTSYTAPNTPSHTPGGGADRYVVYSFFTVGAAGGTPPVVNSVPTGYTLGATSFQSNAFWPCLAVAYAFVDVVTSEDPDAWSLSNADSGGCWAVTSAITATAGVAEVAAGNHTHAVNDATDVGTGATTKGDLLVFDGTDYERLAVGSNNQILTADSAQSLGVKWAAAAASVSAIDDLSDVDTTTAAPASGDLLYFDGTNWVPVTPLSAPANLVGELLMQDGVTNPPVPIETEAQDDWLYSD